MHKIGNRQQLARSGSFRVFESRPGAETRLYCIPHAGGGASFFRPWVARVPSTVEVVAVQYPGHEDRLGEPRAGSLLELADLLVEEFAALLDRPYVLFGHSMGAAVAREVALRLEERGWPLPRRLVVSGRPASSCRQRWGHHMLDDDAFIEELRKLGGAADDVLDHPALRELLLPVVRHDYRLIDEYEPSPGRLRRVSVLACVGGDDEAVPLVSARAWGEETTGRFELRVFPGGHFYLRDESVLDEVLRIVLSATGTP